SPCSTVTRFCTSASSAPTKRHSATAAASTISAGNSQRANRRKVGGGGEYRLIGTCSRFEVRHHAAEPWTRCAAIVERLCDWRPARGGARVFLHWPAPPSERPLEPFRHVEF